MRASDADRQRTVDELRRHCAAGRIDVEEYASRIERAMAATTLEELDDLRADLPMMCIEIPSRAYAIPGGQPELQSGDKSPRSRLTALVLAALTVAVVVGGLLVAVLAEWAWAAVLLVAWAVGLLQGRLSAPRRRPLIRR